MKLNPWVVGGGVLVTGGMFAMLGYGIGRESAARDNPPASPLAMTVPAFGESGPADLIRQAAATTSRRPDHVVYVRDDGTIAQEEPRWLVFVSREGRLSNATSERRDFHAPRFSPDGRRVSVDFSDSDGRDVWIFSLDQGTLSRATFDRDAHDATWTRDGQHITYTSFRTGSLGIYMTRPGSRSMSDSLLANQSLTYTGTWLPDRSGLVTTANNLSPNSQSDIGFVANAGRGPIEPVLANRFSTEFPAVSPDGKWLAYTSTQSGDEQVYVRPWRREGDEVLVSRGAGTEPVWSRDGRRLYYRSKLRQDSDLIEATVTRGSSFRVTDQRVLFTMTDMVSEHPHANYDVSPDGETFVMIRRSPSTRIIVLQNLPAIVRDERDSRQR
jgi:Tol biopolymer transport system component